MRASAHPRDGVHLSAESLPTASLPTASLPTASLSALLSLLPPVLADHFLDLTDGEELSGVETARAMHAATRLWARDMSRFFHDFAYAEGDLPC